MSKSKSETTSDWIARTFIRSASHGELLRMLQFARQEGAKRLEDVGGELVAHCHEGQRGPLKISLASQLAISQRAEAAKAAEAKATEAKATEAKAAEAKASEAKASEAKASEAKASEATTP